MAWKPEIDVQDQDGLTPLHVAIKAADGAKSTNLARILRVRGAAKNISDN